MKRATEKVAGALRRSDHPAAPLVEPAAIAPPTPAENVPSAPPAPEPDPVEAMRRFTKRQQ